MSEPLLVVEEGGEVGDEDDEHGRHIDCHEVAEDVPFEENLHLVILMLYMVMVMVFTIEDVEMIRLVSPKLLSCHRQRLRR